MALVVPNQGELQLLQKLLKNTSDTEDYLLRLYQNNYNPVEGSVLGSFTEADFTNYAQKTIARGDWAAPSINGSNKAESSVAAQSWTCGASGNTVYGYYIVGATSGVVLWAEKFSVSRVLGDGDILNVTPIFNLSSAN